MEAPLGRDGGEAKRQRQVNQAPERLRTLDGAPELGERRHVRSAAVSCDHGPEIYVKSPTQRSP